MACHVIELEKPACERYWPQVEQSFQIGALTITTTHEEKFSNDLVIRDFVAEYKEDKQYVRQYHYLGWQHGKPDSPDLVIKIWEMIDSYRYAKDIPVVVHCSTGCGRTGAIISIDIAKKMLLSRKKIPDVSVYRIVDNLNQQRPSMVQSKDQYVFIYMAVAELAHTLPVPPPIPPKLRAAKLTSTGKGTDAGMKNNGWVCKNMITGVVCYITMSSP